MRLAVRRLLAYWLDFVLLAVILAGLQWAVYMITAGFAFNRLRSGYEIEWWVLITISFPTWAYFIFWEWCRQETIGKRLLKLKVVSNDGSSPAFKQAALRTLIRLLPWEMTHLIILVPDPWWSVDRPENEYLIWIPNIIMFVYIMLLFLNQGESGLHDRVVRTRVEEAQRVKSHKPINTQEFKKGIIFSLTVTSIVLLIFMTTSLITHNWYFLIAAVWSVVLVNGMTLAPLYAAYKRNQKEI
jgi:uncharacterized RDD family membrane protein YckC